MAAPPAGYLFDELVAHPVEVTNFRGIDNDHVATHATALVLSLARGLPRYARQQAKADWTRHTAASDIMHLPDATAVVVGVGGKPVWPIQQEREMGTSEGPGHETGGRVQENKNCEQEG